MPSTPYFSVSFTHEELHTLDLILEDAHREAREFPHEVPFIGVAAIAGVTGIQEAVREAMPCRWPDDDDVDPGEVFGPIIAGLVKRNSKK